MKNHISNNLSPEFKVITRYILMGFSRNAISEKMNFSISCISNKINKLFSIFNASNKHEFIINIFHEIIKEKQLEIKDREKDLKNTNIKLKNLTNLIKNIIKFKEDKNKLLTWINRTEIYLKK